MLSADAAFGPPVAHRRPQARMIDQPAFHTRAASPEKTGGQDEIDRSRQNRYEIPGYADDEEDAAESEKDNTHWFERTVQSRYENLRTKSNLLQ